MKPDEIKLGDWMRMWVGNAPPEFFIEIVIRVLFLFILLVIAMRLLGLRMSAQLNRIEMIALFSLAAAIGVPLQSPDRGLLPAVVIALVVVGIGRLVAKIAYSSQKFEQLSEGNYAILIRDGVLQMHELKKTRLTVQRLMAQLRSESVRHLGEVKRVYFEAEGTFTLVREQAPKPGLSILPRFDEAFLQEQQQDQTQVCGTCGAAAPARNVAETKCANCSDTCWEHAIR